MAHYYFHFRRGLLLEEDEDGLEFDGPDDAMREADQMTRDILSEELRAELRSMLDANDDYAVDLDLSLEQKTEQLKHLKAERSRVDAGIAELESMLGSS